MDSRPKFFHEAVKAKVSGALSDDDFDLLMSAGRQADSEDKVGYLAEILKLVVSGVITNADLRAMVSTPVAQVESPMDNIVGTAASTAQPHGPIDLCSPEPEHRIKEEEVHIEAEPSASDHGDYPGRQNLPITEEPASLLPPSDNPTVSVDVHDRCDQADRMSSSSALISKSHIPEQPAARRSKTVILPHRDPQLEVARVRAASQGSTSALSFAETYRLPATAADAANNKSLAEGRATASIDTASKLPRTDTSTEDIPPPVPIKAWSTFPLQPELIVALREHDLQQPSQAQATLVNLLLEHEEPVFVVIGAQGDVSEPAVQVCIVDAALKATQKDRERRSQRGSTALKRPQDQSPTEAHRILAPSAPSSRPCAKPALIVIVQNTSIGGKVSDDLRKLCTKETTLLELDEYSHQRSLPRPNQSIDIVVSTARSAKDMVKKRLLDLSNVRQVVWADATKLFGSGYNIGPVMGVFDALRSLKHPKQVRHLVLTPSMSTELAGKVRSEGLRQVERPVILEIGTTAPSEIHAPDGLVSGGNCRSVQGHPRKHIETKGKKRAASPNTLLSTSNSEKRSRTSRDATSPDAVAVAASDHGVPKAASPNPQPLSIAGRYSKPDALANAPRHASLRETRIVYAVKVDFKTKSVETIIGDDSKSVLGTIVQAQKGLVTDGGRQRQHVPPVPIPGHESSRKNQSAAVPTSGPSVARKENAHDETAASPADPAALPTTISARGPRSSVRPNEDRQPTSEHHGRQADQTPTLSSTATTEHPPHKSKAHRLTLDDFDELSIRDICPTQTVSPYCKSRCRMVGICWKEACEGQCGKVHGRPCPAFVIGVCKITACALVAHGGHDPRWKGVYGRLESHSWENEWTGT